MENKNITFTLDDKSLLLNQSDEMKKLITLKLTARVNEMINKEIIKHKQRKEKEMEKLMQVMERIKKSDESTTKIEGDYYRTKVKANVVTCKICNTAHNKYTIKVHEKSKKHIKKLSELKNKENDDK